MSRIKQNTSLRPYVGMQKAIDTALAIHLSSEKDKYEGRIVTFVGREIEKDHFEPITKLIINVELFEFKLYFTDNDGLSYEVSSDHDVTITV